MGHLSKKIFFILVLFFYNPFPVQSLSIYDVSIDNPVLDLEHNDQVEFNFSIDEVAVINLSVFDGRNWLIKKISSKKLQPGNHKLFWNGKDQAKKIVPNEVYFYTLKAVSETEEIVVHDLTDVTGGDRLPLENIRWEATNQKIQYGLREASWVVIRAGLKDHGPLLRTIIDWVPRTKGSHFEKWDGMDSSGVIDLSNHPNLEWAVDAFTLPKNHIIVVGNAASKRLIPEPSWDIEVREKTHHAKPKIYAPYLLSAEKRGDFPLKLSLVHQYPKNKEGIPVVSGVVPIRLDVDLKHLENIASQRFEPVFFVDGLFAYENEVGFFPMTYKWDSSSINPGLHFITANLRGYLSNFGIATIKLYVTKPEGD